MMPMILRMNPMLLYGSVATGSINAINMMNPKPVNKYENKIHTPMH